MAAEQPQISHFLIIHFNHHNHVRIKISLFHDGQRVATLKTSDGTMVESKVSSSSLVLALKNLRGCLHAVGYKDDSDEILTVDDAIQEFEND